jgi:hypothetical protein
MKDKDFTINMTNFKNAQMLIDNLPIGEAIKVVSYYDSRPLTDETLKELGFIQEKLSSNYQGMYSEWYYDVVMYDLCANKQEDGTLYVEFDACNNSPIWKTVGSVKMLIETLKGDE